ncbi:MAG: hypothetical protein H7Y59_16210 [Anaerolineales bacterium]|nr:hypothetical protein [Anaerolineales bacterium]
MSLIGIWKQIEPPSLEEEDVYLKFESDGILIYQAQLKEKIQQSNLAYKVVGNCIVSDQPSKPKQESTEFFFENDDVLVLIHDGSQTKYFRQSQQS